ncbi:Ribosomal RNA small subunit methyltransferase G [Alteracholeplasma palmae J233]|uniref:Ribosomal RNA small subunit methyltransferase G n=1 Tax=Alteracholeplasma palmae (strain ATCC 49389 / J233) TaxID=1318466 RepID=U4KSE4_ALTPJ|nr:16S rRNA (guanine(527)-N(7))-methyltransferase RsmG [Alteracholeplasma palmae]CCV64936.1 Ribosomal RNA small subunit methyltransferase G [Alteracholeplasma palmae J233]
MFQDNLKELDIVLNEEQLKQFETYYEFLIEYNKITNLTAITDKKEVYYKHFFDSLSLTTSLDFNQIKNMCDIGAGAGFPSIPIKIVYPHLEVTIVDSLGKRIKFLEQLSEKLNLSNINLVHERAEIFALTHLNSFDLVSARAVGHLALILELGIPMVKPKGYFIAPKGSNYKEELNDSKNALKVLKTELIKENTFSLPYDFGFRSNLVFVKKQNVNGYPRPYAQINKNRL